MNSDFVHYAMNGIVEGKVACRNTTRASSAGRAGLENTDNAHYWV